MKHDEFCIRARADKIVERLFDDFDKFVLDQVKEGRNKEAAAFGFVVRGMSMVLAQIEILAERLDALEKKR